MKTKVVTFLIHFTAWVIFLSLPYIFRPKAMVVPGVVMPDETTMLVRFLTFNAYLIFVFYLHGYWMMPRLLLKRRWFVYTILLLILFLSFLFLREILFAKKPPVGMPFPIRDKHRSEFELFRPETGNAVFLFSVILIISAGVRIVQEWMRAEKKTKQIETERIEMELSFLRSQINPHFLFNTLNSIYSLALIKSDMTADAVMKLSDIMRYMTVDSNSEMVPLDREVDYLKHYVDLQKIRLGESTPVILELSGKFKDFMIPPLILMPFIENAFKYGISNHEKAGISIMLKTENTFLTLKVSNLIFKERNYPATTGLGISNTRQRLEHIYPDRYILEIKENQKFFMVNLKIQLE
jgi:two-component system, LytTR family, sensor kinase